MLHGADINAKFGIDNDLTPIHSATTGGHIDIVELLLDNGADISFDALRIITEASEKGHKDIAKIIVKELVRLETVESQTISKDVLAAINKLEYLKSFKKECDNEMERIKGTFPATIVAYFSVFRMEPHDLASIVANENILSEINSEDFLSKKFPLYGSAIVKRLSMGIARKGLLVQLSRFFSCLYDNQDEKLPQITPNCAKEIFRYLNDDELSTLIGVFKTSKKA